MGEMNRTQVGHGNGGNPIDAAGKKLSNFNGGLMGMFAQNKQIAHEQTLQQRQHEHERGMQDSAQLHESHMLVGRHVLSKDMHKHLLKNAEPGTGISMEYGDIKTSITKRQPKSRSEHFAESAAAPMETAPEAPKTEEQPTPAQSAPAQPTGHSVNLGSTIPTNPGEWQGGWMEHNPQTGRAQVKPGYAEYKTKKQHFEAGMASQQAAQAGQHFVIKSGIKIPNYAKKAMQKRAKGK